MGARGILLGGVAAIAWAICGGSLLAEPGTPSQKSTPKIKLGFEVATPHGTKLLLGFMATGPIAILRQIEVQIKEMNCPPVSITENGDDAKIVVMFSEACDAIQAADFAGKINNGLYPELTVNVMVLPVAERK